MVVARQLDIRLSPSSFPTQTPLLKPTTHLHISKQDERPRHLETRAGTGRPGGRGLAPALEPPGRHARRGGGEW